MPDPVWLIRYEINPLCLPLNPENREAIAEKLDDLATMLHERAADLRKGEGQGPTTEICLVDA